MSEAGADDAVGAVTEFVHLLAAGEVAKGLAMIDAAAVISEPASLPFGGERVGPDGFVDLLRAIGAEYKVRMAEPAVAAAGDRVIVRVHGTITAHASGRQMPLDAIDLYEACGGRITRLDVYYKDAAAVTALRDADPAVSGFVSQADGGSRR